MIAIRPGSIKICSLREVAHADFVADAGVDLFGLIMVPGVRRYVEPVRAREIVLAVRARTPEQSPLAVGVFRNESPGEINRIASEVGLDIAQLHGEEPPEYVRELELPAVKVIAMRDGATFDELNRAVARYDAAPISPIAYQLDAEQGGSGKTVDWSLAAELAARWPIMLAGGLTPENVVDAIVTVRPVGVDVSSGVETDGAKDPAKIASFASRARAIYQSPEFNAGP